MARTKQTARRVTRTVLIISANPHHVPRVRVEEPLVYNHAIRSMLEYKLNAKQLPDLTIRLESSISTSLSCTICSLNVPDYHADWRARNRYAETLLTLAGIRSSGDNMQMTHVYESSYTPVSPYYHHYSYSEDDNNIPYVDGDPLYGDVILIGAAFTNLNEMVIDTVMNTMQHVDVDGAIVGDARTDHAPIFTPEHSPNSELELVRSDGLSRPRQGKTLLQISLVSSVDSIHPERPSDQDDFAPPIKKKRKRDASDEFIEPTPTKRQKKSRTLRKTSGKHNPRSKQRRNAKKID